jgi:ceramide glucosyltransferase
VFMVLAFLALISLLIILWQWVVAWKFPLHRRMGDKTFAPPLTLLKPLKGLDDNTMECLKSWLRQDYTGPVQVLFGVASEQDPVCELVEQLIKKYPHANIKLVFCHESLGVNAKVSSLIQLLRKAENEVIVVSDADVFVPKDFLTNAVAPLRATEVGLVNCFYRLANPSTFAMRWEAIAINADFWSHVLQSQSLASLDFALGAVMVTRRDALLKMGGFDVLADHLADDFQLGNRMLRQTGKQIALCPIVVDCRSAPMNWREVWAHQLRWARTIRVCRPVPYALTIFSNATLWPLLWAVAYPCPWSFLTLGVCLFLRVMTSQDLQKRLGTVAGQWRFWWLAPVKDLLQCALWALAFYGNHITWRGQRFRLQRDGRLVRD